MAMHLRARLLALRSEQRDAEGRFTGGDGNPDHLTQSEMDRRATEATRGMGTTPTGVCSHCSRLTNGPHMGELLGFMPDKSASTQRSERWSHGVCPQHYYETMVSRYRKHGMTHVQAARAADARVRVVVPQALLDKSGYVSPDVIARAKLADLLTRLRALQEFDMTLAPDILHLRMRLVALQVATTERGLSGGRIPIFAMGADGHVHFAGSTPGPEHQAFLDAVEKIKTEHAKVLSENPKALAHLTNAQKEAVKSFLPATTKIDSNLRRLGELDDPLDPIEAWNTFGGAAGLRTFLQNEQPGVLAGMLAHVNMPPGPTPKSASSKKMADAIISRLSAYYATPEAQRPALGKDSVATSLGTLGQLNDPLDPMEALRTYGAANLRQILMQEQPGTLSGMLRHSNMPPGASPKGNSKTALVNAIISRLQPAPAKAPSTAKTATATPLVPIRRYRTNVLDPLPRQICIPHQALWT